MQFSTENAEVSGLVLGSNLETWILSGLVVPDLYQSFRVYVIPQFMRGGNESTMLVHSSFTETM